MKKSCGVGKYVALYEEGEGAKFGEGVDVKLIKAKDYVKWSKRNLGFGFVINNYEKKSR